MDSNLHHQDHFFQVQQEQSTQEKQMGSGLMRYQSAPSSYFSTFLDKELSEEFLNRPTSPETERFFERILANSESFSGQVSVHIKQGSPVEEAKQVQNNTGFVQQPGSYSSPVSYPSIPPQPRPAPPFLEQNSGSGMDYRVVASMGMEKLPQLKVGIGATGGGGSCNRNSNSTLVRHSSSPAGFFSNINIEMENGYPVMRGMGDYGTGNRDTTYSAVSRPPHPSSGRMSPIAENGNNNMGKNRPANAGGFGESPGGNYITGFSIGSWDDSSTIPPAGGNGFTDNDRTFSGLNEVENQLNGGEAANAPRMLARHLSLQNTSAEMAALEKILQLQDSVPCKVRAKRGCATHPRSIAERMRRTRISERMRKLQDLVPNMEKQTNTADMLDLAVDYIKDLQREVKPSMINTPKLCWQSYPPYIFFQRTGQIVRAQRCINNWLGKSIGVGL